MSSEEHLKKIEEKCREKIALTLGRIDNVPEGSERDYYLLAVSGWRATLASIGMCRNFRKIANNGIVAKSLVTAACFVELAITEEWSRELL